MMRRLLAAAVLALSCAPAGAADLLRPLALYGVGGAADYFTTRAAVARGGLERSPLGPTAGPLLTAGAFTLADLGLQRGGHRRAVVGLRIIGTGLLLGIALSNHRMAR